MVKIKPNNPTSIGKPTGGGPAGAGGGGVPPLAKTTKFPLKNISKNIMLF